MVAHAKVARVFAPIPSLTNVHRCALIYICLDTYINPELESCTINSEPKPKYLEETVTVLGFEAQEDRSLRESLLDANSEVKLEFHFVVYSLIVVSDCAHIFTVCLED